MPMSQELPDWHERPLPAHRCLEGSYARLEPLETKHAAALHDEFSGRTAPLDPILWKYMSSGPFDDLATYTAFVEKCSKSSDPLFYAIIDRQRNRPCGTVSYLRIAPRDGSIEIGWLVFGKSMQRSRVATEVIYLLSAYALGTLKYRRLEWKCDNQNERSRAAAERFGFTFEGVFRQHMVVKKHNRDTAWFSLLDYEWPAVDRAYKAWLEPANFNGDQQIRSLREFIAAERATG